MQNMMHKQRKQQLSSCAAAKPMPQRAAVVMLSMVTAFIMLAQLWNFWHKTHPLDVNTYKIRGVLRLNIHTGCCGVEQKWQQLEYSKRHMPRDPTYQDVTPAQLREQLPVRVISLARAAERRQAMIKTLDGAGLTYEIVDAVDADNASIPIADVKRYVRGVRLKFWKTGIPPQQKKKVAVDLSHYQNIERIAREGKAAVLIEDDAEMPAAIHIAAEQGDRDAWYKGLLTALQELPEDWDVLYLNMCLQTEGRSVAPHVTVIRTGACTLGYVVTPKFARKVYSAIKTAHWHLRTPFVDVLYADMIEHWEVAAYITRPPLLQFSSVPSTMNYTEMWANLTERDLWWIGRRRLHASLKQLQ